MSRILLTEGGQRDALGGIELTDFWGVAGRMALRLTKIGIGTPLACLTPIRDASGRKAVLSWSEWSTNCAARPA